MAEKKTKRDYIKARQLCDVRHLCRFRYRPLIYLPEDDAGFDDLSVMLALAIDASHKRLIQARSPLAPNGATLRA